MASKFEFVNEQEGAMIYYGSPKMLIKIHIDSILAEEGSVYESFTIGSLGSIYAEWVCTKPERESGKKFTEQRNILKKAIDFYLESVHEKKLPIPAGDGGIESLIAKNLLLDFNHAEKKQLLEFLKRFKTDTTIHYLYWNLDRLSSCLDLK